MIMVIGVMSTGMCRPPVRRCTKHCRCSASPDPPIVKRLAAPREMGPSVRSCGPKKAHRRSQGLQTCSFFVVVVVTSHYVDTQLTIQVQQERTQVFCSNREARKRPAESNGIPAMDRDLGHMNVVLKWCVCMSVVDLGFGIIILIVLIIINVFSFLFFPSFVSFLFGPFWS